MTVFKDGDKVRATNGENVLVGELRLAYGVEGVYFDIGLGDDAQFAQLHHDDWTLELIPPPEPTAREILDALKIGTRFRYAASSGYWIKIALDGYIYVTSPSSAPNTTHSLSADGFGYGGAIEVIEDDS